MKETSKSLPRRLRRGYGALLVGSGIDIGAGDDPLQVPDAQVYAYDMQQGDAQTLMDRSNEMYDFVYSSHCLEHMRNVEFALFNWTRVLKHGGYLFIAVPDYELYEHMHWPSKHNPDHKQSFSLTLSRYVVGRNTHYHMASQIVPLLQSLGVATKVLELEDDCYNYADKVSDQTLKDAQAQILLIGQKV